MEQIEVEVARSGALQADMYFIFRLLLTFAGELCSIEFAGQVIALSGIPVAESRFGSLFGALVHIRRVEIFSTRLDKGIDHAFGVFHIDVLCSLHFGQTHQSEAQFHTIVYQFFHSIVFVTKLIDCKYR